MGSIWVRMKYFVLCLFLLQLSAVAISASLLEEVVVTAQKREQNIQDVGVSVSAFSGEAMEKLKFSSTADVVSQTPNVEARRHFISRGLTTNLFIRGVGTTQFNNANESSIAGFVDEFYLVSPSTLDFLLFDMSGTEILRGPQGTLFGRNATGGAFQFSTKKPSTEGVDGRVKASVGNYDAYVVEGAINVPLGDSAAIRLSAITDQHDHLAKNIFPGKGGALDQDFSAFRAQLAVDITENLSLTVKAETGQVEGDLTADQGVPYDLLDTLAGGGEVVELPADGFGYSPTADGTRNNPDRFNANGNNEGSNEVDHLLARFDLDLENMTFSSITGYMDQTFSLSEDCDGSPNGFCSYNPEYESQHFTQEFRIVGNTENLNYTAGLFYMNQDSESDVIVPVFVGLGVFPPAGGGIGGAVLDVDFQQELTSMAAYAQFEYSLSEELILIGGVRINRDEKEFNQNLFFPIVEYPGRTDSNFASIAEMRAYVETGGSLAPANIFNKATAGSLTEINDTNYGVTLQVNYTPNEDTLMYASFRRGLKGGGFNNEVMPAGLPANLIPFDQEVIHAYELGWKQTLANGLGRINGAVFYYDYQDYQATSFQNFGNFITNNDASLSGAEIELFLTPTEGLSIIVGASYLDSNVDDVVMPGGLVQDREMGEAPEFGFNALVNYEWGVDALNGSLSVQLDGNYVGERFADVLNQKGLELDSHTIFNSVLAYSHDSGKWGVDLWIKNLTDERVELFKLEIDNLAGTLNGQVNWNAPRTYGASVFYNF